jgi:uncharacterized protein (DUF302 family)
MPRNPTNRLLTAMTGAVLLFCAAGQTLAQQYQVYESDSSFEDVLDGLKLAIQERGMYINNVMHMDEMLERTGKDLGMDEQIYGHAQSVEFCSAVLSRKMTSEDPTRIVNCPFIIAVYTLPGDADTTFLVHRATAQRPIREIAEMLETRPAGNPSAQAQHPEMRRDRWDSDAEPLLRATPTLSALTSHTQVLVAMHAPRTRSLRYASSP